MNLKGIWAPIVNLIIDFNGHRKVIEGIHLDESAECSTISSELAKKLNEILVVDVRGQTEFAVIIFHIFVIMSI